VLAGGAARGHGRGSAPAQAAAAAAGGRGEETENRECGRRRRTGDAGGDRAPGMRERARPGRGSISPEGPAGDSGPSLQEHPWVLPPLPSTFPAQGRFLCPLSQGRAARCPWLAVAQGRLPGWQGGG